MEKFVDVYTSFKAYVENCTLETDGANALLLKNEGGVTVRLEGLVTIAPNEAMPISQVSVFARDRSMYKIAFDMADSRNTSAVKLLVVARIGIPQ